MMFGYGAFYPVLGTIDPVVGLVVAALVGAMGSFLISSKSLSGKIKTSEATDLWKESTAIREWATKRGDELAAHVEKLEARMVELEKANTDLATENRQLTREVYNLSTTIIELKAENTSLTGLLAHAKGEVEEWKAIAESSPRRRSSDSHNVKEGNPE